MLRSCCILRTSTTAKLFARHPGSVRQVPVTQFTAWSSFRRVRPLNTLMWATSRLSGRQAVSIAEKFKRFLATETATAAKAALVDTSPRAQKIVGYWFLGCAGLVFGAVMLGGITRLTESGLSMVDWHLIKGMRPPLTQADWETEFAKYQQYPEYKYANQGMTLSEFKRIWYMEYAHRMWGRLIGTAFLLPAGYFWARGYFNKGLKVRVGVLGALVVGQGLLGWYMVKSGLDEELISKTEIPRVSQYRLASHLGLAFIAYAGMFWSALGQLLPRSQYEVTRELRRFRMWAHISKGMVFLTAFSGALVAGLDAGLVYNSWPKMADRWIPTDLAALSPGWKNIFENATTVQFDHRLLGHTTIGIITGLWLAARPLNLPGRARVAVHCMMGMAVVQVSLGILTLLYYVPTHLAATHQAGSLTLLSIALWLTSELRKPLVPK